MSVEGKLGCCCNPECGSIVVNAMMRHPGWFSSDATERGSWRYEYGDDADTPGWVKGNAVWAAIAGAGAGLDGFATLANDCAAAETRFLTLTYLYESDDPFSGGWGDAGLTRMYRVVLTMDKRLGKLYRRTEHFKMATDSLWELAYDWYVSPLNNINEVGVPIGTNGFAFNAPGTLIAAFTDLVLTSAVTATTATTEMTYGGYFQRITLTCSDPYTKADAEADANALLDLVGISTQAAALAGRYTINGIADTPLRMDTQIFIQYAETYPVRVHIYSHDYPGFFDYQTAQSLVLGVPTDPPCAETYLDGLLSKYNYKPVFFSWYSISSYLGTYSHGVGHWQVAKCGVATKRQSTCLQAWWGEYCREFQISPGPPVVISHYPYDKWFTADAGYPLGVIEVKPFDDWPDTNPNTEGFSCLKPFDISTPWLVLEPGDVIDTNGLGRIAMKCKLQATAFCCDEPETFDFTHSPHTY